MKVGSILEEAAIADLGEGHPSLQRGKNAFDLSPDLTDHCVVAFLRGPQLRAAAPTLMHDTRLDAEAGKPHPPRALGIGLVRIDRPLVATHQIVCRHRVVDVGWRQLQRSDQPRGLIDAGMYLITVM